MDYNLVLKTLAEQDLTQATEWYETQLENFLEDFIDDIDFGLESIKENPEHFQKRYGEIRVVFTRKFPYGIYYTIEESVIFIHAILHTKQNPETGIGRV